MAAGLLLESLDDDSQESRASLLSLGDNIAADLTTSISQFGLIDGCSEFDYLGQRTAGPASCIPSFVGQKPPTDPRVSNAWIGAGN